MGACDGEFDKNTTKGTSRLEQLPQSLLYLPTPGVVGWLVGCSTPVRLSTCLPACLRHARRCYAESGSPGWLHLFLGRQQEEHAARAVRSQPPVDVTISAFVSNLALFATVFRSRHHIWIPPTRGPETKTKRGVAAGPWPGPPTHTRILLVCT